MPDVVIQVEKLWKQYRLGAINHGTLSRDLQSWWARVRGKEDPNLRLDQSLGFSVSPGKSTPDNKPSDRFWALKDLSFSVHQGEVVGIIGRNGAGKSTLLKILSQVTAPTKGEVRIRGRIASLLEVGTGFHPELTGRENIFLNGAILGMSKAEIRQKLDEIIAFAEVAKFIDTPVKRYSSGMYVRLAFAVAAHLEPEILIVDEVLAVGDAEFQKKCLGKMEEVGKQGRTVLFVSHNMGAVSALCDRSLLMMDGRLVNTGLTKNIVDQYLSSFGCGKAAKKIDVSEHKEAFITDIYFVDSLCQPISVLMSGGSYSVVIKYTANVDLRKPIFKVSIYNSSGQMLTHLNNNLSGNEINILKKGIGSVVCNIDKLPLAKGNYSINVSINSEKVLDHLCDALYFRVESGDYFNNGRVGEDLKEICFVSQSWRITNVCD